MKILVLNAGSSTQKSRLYEIGTELPELAPSPLWEAQIDGTQLKVTTATGVLNEEINNAPSTSIARMLGTTWSGAARVLASPAEIDVVGHRVVHGGREYSFSTRIDANVKAAIARLAKLAPAHNPAALEGMEAVEQLLGNVPQIAVFDTAFHSTLPDAAAIYPGPYEWIDQGIRRYGFHGISHEYCAGRAAQLLGKDLVSLRLITCHLGNGCSLAAIKNGRSVDTTMGFTPLEGLMMGTRSGSIDPGILLYQMREKGFSADQLGGVLNRESGLKGISGLSGDMREIAAAIAQGDQRAQLAFDIYVHRLRFHIGAMLASLGGLDALIFTAGVGENSAPVRAAACQAFGFMGLQIDLGKNENRPVDEDISTPDSTVRVLVIQTQEDWAIARQCWKFAAHLPVRCQDQ
jgi:acetate kinase